MVDQDKVILMTKLASYETNEGKKNMSVGNFFRTDYISWQVLKSIVSATIAFAVIMALVLVYDFEILMVDIYKTDLLAYGKKILVWYAVFVGGFSVITYIVYTYRYSKVRKSLKLYYHNLKKVSNMNKTRSV